MSVREEERNKSCSNRGLGIAAAAIGVGVGAALYCIFSKRPEHPNDDGATTSSWSCEDAQSLHDSSYSTISEHSTTDTSINSTSSEEHNLYRHWNRCDSIETISVSDSDQSDFEDSSEPTFSGHYSTISDDSETDMEWDVTRSSLDVPRDVRSQTPSPLRQISNLSRRIRNRIRKSSQMEVNMLSEQHFRERSWALEECSICFETMQKDQELFSLPCTHRYHQACILPWLEQQQTCPCCRKAI